MTTNNDPRHGMYRITYTDGTASRSLIEATCPNEALCVAKAAIATDSHASFFFTDAALAAMPTPASAEYVRTVEEEQARLAALPD